MTTVTERNPARDKEDTIRFNVRIPKENPRYFDVGTQTEVTGNQYENGCPDLKRKCLFENYQLHKRSYLLLLDFPKLYKSEFDFVDEELCLTG